MTIYASKQTVKWSSRPIRQASKQTNHTQTSQTKTKPNRDSKKHRRQEEKKKERKEEEEKEKKTIPRHLQHNNRERGRGETGCLCQLPRLCPPLSLGDLALDATASRCVFHVRCAPTVTPRKVGLSTCDIGVFSSLSITFSFTVENEKYFSWKTGGEGGEENRAVRDWGQRG